jgi:hypothetical protein
MRSALQAIAPRGLEVGSIGVGLRSWFRVDSTAAAASEIS